MDLRDLYPAVLTLIMITILLAIGLTVLSNIDSAIDQDSSVTDESITITAHTGTTTNDEVTAITQFGNDTFEHITDGNRTDAVLNFTAAGVITIAGDIGINASAHTFNISYEYNLDTDASNAVASSVTAIDDFVPWFAVIVVIISAAIILGLVIRQLSSGR